MPKIIKVLNEFGPLLVFFIVYKYYDMIEATKALMAFSFITMGITYYYEKHIPKSQIIFLAILLVFGSMTVFTKDPTFIKIKPTIVYTLIAAILFVSLLMKKVILKDLLDKAIPLTDKGWNILTKRCAIFFFFLALCNEILWRNLSEELWVTFKVFGFTLMLVLFLVSHISFFTKHKRNTK